MNPIGTWKTKEVQHFSLENGLEWKTVEELEALGEDESTLALYRDSRTVFTEDGRVETLMPLPEGVTRDQLEEEGMEVRDGVAVFGVTEWKNEDGRILYNTGVEGEVLGEEVSPWIELEEKDGVIELQMMRLERAE